MANSDDDDNDGKMTMTVMVVAMAIIANTYDRFSMSSSIANDLYILINLILATIYGAGTSMIPFYRIALYMKHREVMSLA